MHIKMPQVRGQNESSALWCGNVDGNIRCSGAMHRGDGKEKIIKKSLTDGGIGEDALDGMGSKWDHRECRDRVSNSMKVGFHRTRGVKKRIISTESTYHRTSICLLREANLVGATMIIVASCSFHLFKSDTPE